MTHIGGITRATAGKGKAGQRRRIDPDGPLASALLALLTTAGIFYVNIIAALINELRESLGFSAQIAGLVGSANIYGAAVGSFALALFSRRLPWRPTAVAALICMIAIDLISILVRESTPLIALRFLHGTAGGALVGVGLSLIGRTKVPDRGFGVLIFLQFLLGGLGVMIIPPLGRIFGISVLYLSLSLVSLLALLATPFIADVQPREVSQHNRASSGPIRWPLLIAAFVGMFLFQAAEMSQAAFSIGMAVSFGVPHHLASTTIGLGAWIGLIGAAGVIFAGLRLRRLGPIVATGVINILIGLLFIAWGRSIPVWAALSFAAAIVWAFGLPYFYGLCSAFDDTGAMAPWAGFFSKLGLATGPIIGGWALGEVHYTHVLWLAASMFSLAIGFSVAPALHLDRKLRRPGSAAGPGLEPLAADLIP